MAKIFVIGDVMLDMDVDVEPRENQEGALLCYTGSMPRYYAGGAANTAKLLLYLGHDVHLFGLQATDWRACELFNNLRSVHMHIWPGLVETPLKTRAYQDGKIVLRLDTESPPGPRLKERVSAPIKQALRMGQEDPPDGIVFVNYDKGVFNEHAGDAIKEMLSWKCVTVLDPKPCEYGYIWDGVFAMTPNCLEAPRISISANHQVITQGKDGCYIISQSTDSCCFHHPPPSDTTPVVNPQVVGAGDAFTARLSSALVEGEEIERAAMFATKFATWYVAQSRAEFWQWAEAAITQNRPEQ